MKPCKIKGIELLKRPLSVGTKKKVDLTFKKHVDVKDGTKNTSQLAAGIDWSVRMAKTARDCNSRNKTR